MSDTTALQLVQLVQPALAMSEDTGPFAWIFKQLCYCFRPKTRAIEKERTVKANDCAFNKKFKYANNYIKTSKYNWITFLPKNLFEQFGRLTNTYFLVLLFLQCVPQITSLSPWTTILPLTTVLFVTAVKDLVDDIHRHSSDNDVNNRMSFIVRDGQLEEDKWMNIKVGDITKLDNDTFVMADLVILSTSEPNGLCYVETADLDGETNLKARQALAETAELDESLDKLTKFNGKLVCEAPNNSISEFEGRLILDKQTAVHIGNDQILLRGCRLRNTKWCYGMVIFAGRDTKVMMNSGKTIFKRTSIDVFLNQLIIGIIIFLIAICAAAAVLNGFWEYKTGRVFTIYLPWDSSIIPNVEEKGVIQILLISTLIFFSYIMLLNTEVPISLYVSVEIIRVLHSRFINWDEKMYYKERT